MSSPFPGMNLYLEHADAWGDFHPAFILRCQDALNLLVGPNYIVKVDTRIYNHDFSSDERRYFARPDVGRPPKTPPGPKRSSSLKS